MKMNRRGSYTPFVRNPLHAVCKLVELEILYSYGCQLKVLPSSFASLRNLLELYLGDNAFEQFPEVICELRSLRKLWMDGIKLSFLPRSFVNLRELREFGDCRRNGLELVVVESKLLQECEIPN